jgi:hypothetical protein
MPRDACDVRSAPGINVGMPCMIEHDGSSIHVRLTPPLGDEWEAIFDEIQAELAPPRPDVIYLPSTLDGGTSSDAEMLRLLGEALAAVGVELLAEP